MKLEHVRVSRLAANVNKAQTESRISTENGKNY
jgi:hypothetical protein